MAEESGRGAGAASARTVLAAALAILLLCSPFEGALPAQETDTIRIAYQEAVEIALRQNTDLARARTETDLRGSVATRERMDFLPQVDLSSGLTRSFGRSFSQEEGAILSETSDFFGMNVSASLDLFNGFERLASVRRAGLEEEASDFQLRRTRQDVVFDVIERYTTLLQNQELAGVREQELEAQEELLDQVRGLVEVGRQPISDLYQQQAARAEAEAALVEARRQSELSKTELMQVLQLDPMGEYEFPAPAPADSLPAGEDTYDLRGLLQAALARRPDLEALESSVEALGQGVREARSGYWPTLSVSFGYGSDWSSEARQAVPGTGSEPRTVTVTPDDGGSPVTFPVPGTGSDPELQHPPLLDQLDARRGGSVQISMSLPLFDRLQTKTSVEQAQADALNARFDRRDQRQLVALQVRQALLDFRSARSQMEATEERLVAATQARDAARRRYELGAATFVELAQAQSNYVSARSARVRAGYSEVLARKLIAYHTGDLQPGDPLFAPSEGDPQ